MGSVCNCIKEVVSLLDQRTDVCPSVRPAHARFVGLNNGQKINWHYLSRAQIRGTYTKSRYILGIYLTYVHILLVHAHVVCVVYKKGDIVKERGGF